MRTIHLHADGLHSCLHANGVKARRWLCINMKQLCCILKGKRETVLLLLIFAVSMYVIRTTRVFGDDVQAMSKCFECNLNAGEQLYLPCGWFHEVRSYGDAEQGGHLALNYWFHPPDNLSSSLQAMQSPYRWVS